MQAGDILFVRGKSWISDVVRYFDVGEFSHVVIAVSETHIFEAQFYTRTRIVPLQYTDYEIVRLDFTEEELHRLRVMCNVLEGRWYDYHQVLGYIFRKWFSTDSKRFNNPNNLICSEALGLILFMLNKIDSPLEDITPNEFYNLLSSQIENNTERVLP